MGLTYVHPGQEGGIVHWNRTKRLTPKRTAWGSALNIHCVLSEHAESGTQFVLGPKRPPCQRGWVGVPIQDRGFVGVLLSVSRNKGTDISLGCYEREEAGSTLRVMMEVVWGVLQEIEYYVNSSSQPN